MFNARSICNKLGALFAYVDHYNPDILAVTETWGRPALLDSFLTPQNYVLFRKDRCDRVGGGVLLLVREKFSPCFFALPDELQNFEDSVWCFLHVSNAKTLLAGCFYRSPSSSDHNNAYLPLLFDFARQSPHDYCALVGDFNCPNIDWTLMNAPESNSFLLDSALDNDLTQMVLDPTRDSHVLDLFLVNDPTFVSSTIVAECFPGSDHKSVSCSLVFDCDNVSSNAPSFQRRFCFSKADWKLYRTLLSTTPWNELLDSEIDAAWSNLKEGILTAATAAIPPVVEVKKMNGIPLTSDVRRAFRQRKRVHRSLKHSNSVLAKEIRTESDIRLRTALSESRRSHERKVAYMSRANPKRFWSYVRASLASKPKVCAVHSSDGCLTSSDQDTAETFNEFFVSLFSPESDSPDNLPLLPSPSSSFCSFSVSEEVVSSVIKSLPSHSSPGPDGISNLLLKVGDRSLLGAISLLFSLILKNGAMPKEWKTATVIPIHKKGSRSECKNFRPISLTCTLCKVFERILKDLMVAYLLENNLLHDSQHGFLPRRSCSTALLSFLESVTGSIDDKESVDVIFLDFSKAFDSVPHNRLFHKLRSYGFSGTVLELLRSFLSNRQQRVLVGNSFSSYKQVGSGVPQGSVLGPLLFVIYINDLDTGIQSRILKFADDVKIFKSFDSLAVNQGDVLQNDILSLSRWSSDWLLKLNPAKCLCLHLGHKNPSRQYFLDNHQIVDVSYVTDLGILITEDLKPSTHCLQVAARGHRLLSTIKLAFKYLDLHSLTCLYKAFIRPVLEYSSEAWCPFLVKDIEILERVQRRFTRFLSAYRDLPYEIRLSKYNLHTLYARRLCCDLTMVYKIIHGFVDVDSSLFFRFPTDSRTRGHQYKIRSSHSRLDIRKYWFTQRVVPFWNSLPISCVEAPNVQSFKNTLWNYLTSIGIN